MPGRQRVREHGTKPELAVPRRHGPRWSLSNADRRAAGMPVLERQLLVRAERYLLRRGEIVLSSEDGDLAELARLRGGGATGVDRGEGPAPRRAVQPARRRLRHD